MVFSEGERVQIDGLVGDAVKEALKYACAYQLWGDCIWRITDQRITDWRIT